MRTALASFTAAAALAVGLSYSEPAHACAGDGGDTIGSICMVAYNFCPRGYGFASGGLVAINSNTALFALVGTTFGGDGRTTFGIPDFRGRVPIGVGSGPGLQNIFWGETRGDEERALLLAQMPNHSHTASATFTPTGGSSGTAADVQVSTSDANKSEPAAGDYLAAPRVPNGPTSSAAFLYTSNPGTTVSLGGVSGGGGSTSGVVNVTINPNGGNSYFDTYDPSVGINFCIALSGIFPSRT